MFVAIRDRRRGEEQKMKFSIVDPSVIKNSSDISDEEDYISAKELSDIYYIYIRICSRVESPTHISTHIRGTWAPCSKDESEVTSRIIKKRNFPSYDYTILVDI